MHEPHTHVGGGVGVASAVTAEVVCCRRTVERSLVGCLLHALAGSPRFDAARGCTMGAKGTEPEMFWDGFRWKEVEVVDDGGKLSGVVSIGDVVRYRVEELEAETI